MLRRLKTQSNNIFVKLLLGLLVASFALWGIGDIFRSAGQSADVVELDGGAISATEYQRELRGRIERFQQLSGQVTSEMLNQLGLPQQVLGEMVHRRVIERAAEDYGVRIPEKSVLRAIRQNPAFLTQDGKFSAEIFREALRQAGVSEQDYFRMLAAEESTRLVLNTLQGDRLVSEPLRAMVAQMHAARRDITIFTLPLSAIGAPAQPDEKALRDYYESHDGSFEEPERRSVAFVKLAYDDVAEDAEPDEATLRDLYEQRRAEFAEPERRSITQLLYNDEKTARNALAELKAGTSPKDVAERYQPLSGVQNLGSITSAEVPEEARETVFNQAEGSVSGPVATTLGWHVFIVGAVHAPREKPFEEVRSLLAEEQRRYDAEDQLYRRITELEDAVAGGATLEEVAGEMGLQATTIENIRAGEANPGLPPIGNLNDILFALEEGSTSEVLTDDNNNAYLFAVQTVVPARKKAFEEVRPQVLAQLQAENRRLALSEAASSTVAAQRKGREIGLQGVSAERRSGITWQQLQEENGDLETGLREAAADLAPGEVSEPTAQGDSYRWVRLDRLVPQETPSETETQAAGSEIGDAYALEIISDYLQHLRGEYHVRVNEEVVRSLLP